jgi:hypothetical protein
LHPIITHALFEESGKEAIFILVAVHLPREQDLLQSIDFLRLLARGNRGSQTADQQAEQQCNDRDHNEDLDNCEGSHTSRPLVSLQRLRSLHAVISL